MLEVFEMMEMMRWGPVDRCGKLAGIYISTRPKHGPLDPFSGVLLLLLP
jgi:hypothetical protein